MPSYKSTFGSFLKQEDLAGKTPRVTIESVALEDIKDPDSGRSEKKLVMHFLNKEKALILNRTNCEVLESITGTDDYQFWAGHHIVLWVDTAVMFGNKRVGGLRVRGINAAPPPPPPPAAPPSMATGEIYDDEIPF